LKIPMHLLLNVMQTEYSVGTKIATSTVLDDFIRSLRNSDN
jgi:hypothetical protein